MLCPFIGGPPQHGFFQLHELVIENCRFVGNEAQSDGGAVYIGFAEGAVDITGSYFEVCAPPSCKWR